MTNDADHAVLDAEWRRAFDALNAAGLEADADHPIAAAYRAASDAVNHANRSRDFAIAAAWGRGTAMAPIYRTWLADGRVFVYAPTPWQASAYGQGKLPLWWEMVVDNAPCENCGRSDLPLHTDNRCPDHSRYSTEVLP